VARAPICEPKRRVFTPAVDDDVAGFALLVRSWRTSRTCVTVFTNIGYPPASEDNPDAGETHGWDGETRPTRHESSSELSEDLVQQLRNAGRRTLAIEQMCDRAEQVPEEIPGS